MADFNWQSISTPASAAQRNSCLANFLSVIHLFSVPFGTALGINGLWVLLQQETESLF